MKEFIQHSSLYQMRTQWTDLAKELNLSPSFKTQKLYWLKTILKPSISGIKHGFHLNIALKRTGLLAKNTIECSVKIKNSNFLSFTILSEKKRRSNTTFVSEQEEFENLFKISTNKSKELDYVLSPKIRASILRLTNNEQKIKIRFAHKGSVSDRETLILDANEKSTLSFVVKEVSLLTYNDKNYIKDVVSSLIQIAKKIESLK